MKKYYSTQLITLLSSKIVNIILLIVVFSEIIYAFVYAAFDPSLTHSYIGSSPTTSQMLRLDDRLPVQTLSQQSNFTNINAKFGSRFDFAVEPGKAQVRSGTEGIFRDNAASYAIGVAPAGQHQTFLFHMGQLDLQQGDAYLQNERWIQGLDTTRWMADMNDIHTINGISTMGSKQQLQLTVDIIDPFLGEPGCTQIAACRSAVRDDTVPVFLVGVTLHNVSSTPQAGQFLFGSNRLLSSTDPCISSVTPAKTAMTTLTYATQADVAGGTLLLAGDRAHWQCKLVPADRVGLTWSYHLAPRQSEAAYLFLGSWNPARALFTNTQLPAHCQQEGLYATTEWSSLLDMVHFASDNLFRGDNLLGRAQAMENILIQNNVLTPEQRWLIGDALRSYKASSWLMARPSCAGGGYDAAVYEGTYGYLTTVDVMHEYGYFEITRVPWFFKAALSTVLQNATHNAFGLYFQHDQGGDVLPDGRCTHPGGGIPTLRAACYVPPYDYNGAPMPTEENDNVALLLAYYVFVTGDHAFLRQHIDQLDAAMQHNMAVGDPQTGIAYRFQDTKTTYDAASDCLHNDLPGAGNLFYQGVKELAGYRATAYLDQLLARRQPASTWQQAASKIEGAMLTIAHVHGFLPVAENTASSNCSGRTITLGEGLLYLHLIGQDRFVSQALLHVLAAQYPADLQATTLHDPPMIAMTSTQASGPPCGTGHCHRYTWFSKVMLSGLVADLVYTHYGCSSCTRLNMVSAAYTYNINASNGFSDGFHDDRRDWGGHFYPRGLISWAFLQSAY
jgi:hypothetical protein